MTNLEEHQDRAKVALDRLGQLKEGL